MRLSHLILCLLLPFAQQLPAQTAGESSAQKPSVIRLGTTQSLTGRFAEEGTLQLNGLKMWAADVNSRGRLLGASVEIVHYDDQSDSEQVANLYESLITEDKVDLLVGPYGSELTLIATDVAERHNRPIVTAAASAEEIWARGYRNVFGIDVPSSNYMDLALEEASRRGAKTGGLFYATGAFAEDVAAGVRREAERLGIRLVMDTQYDPSSVDFSALGKELLSIEDEADVVFGACYLADSVAIAKAMGKGRRLKVDMVALTVGPALREFSTMLNNQVNGVVGVVQWLRSVPLPGAQDFSYRYRQMHGNNPGVHAAIGYSAGQVSEAAVRLADTLDPAALRDQLRSMRFRSLIGHYEVDGNGRQVGKSNYLLQWQDGNRRLVAPANVAERELIYPRP